MTAMRDHLSASSKLSTQSSYMRYNQADLHLIRALSRTLSRINLIYFSIPFAILVSHGIFLMAVSSFFVALIFRDFQEILLRPVVEATGALDQGFQSLWAWLDTPLVSS